MEEELYDVDNYPMSSIEAMKKMINQMENSICQISINSEVKGTGFLCNIILDDWETIKVLITTTFVLTGNDILPGTKINISFNNKKLNKEILIDQNRKAYICSNYMIDAIFIEIKKTDGFKADSFLNIDETILDNENPQETLKKCQYIYCIIQKGM